MKIYDLSHIVEVLYQNSTNFNVNTIQNTRFNVIYINDPNYLNRISEYESRGYEVINRLGDSPYEPKILPIYPMFNFPSELPVCIDNAHLIKYLYVDGKLLVNFPERGMDYYYDNKLTYLGMVNFNIYYKNGKQQFKLE